MWRGRLFFLCLALALLSGCAPGGPVAEAGADALLPADKLIAITFGMHLNEKETQRVLKLAGHSALYPRVVRDALILFSIQRGKDIWETDDALESNGFQTLLSAE